jgi:hypothetical protein
MATAEQQRRAAQERRHSAVQAVTEALAGAAFSAASVNGMPCLIGPGGRRIVVVALHADTDAVAIVTAAGEVSMVEVRQA